MALRCHLRGGGAGRYCCSNYGCSSPGASCGCSSLGSGCSSGALMMCGVVEGAAMYNIRTSLSGWSLDLGFRVQAASWSHILGARCPCLPSWRLIRQKTCRAGGPSLLCSHVGCRVDARSSQGRPVARQHVLRARAVEGPAAAAPESGVGCCRTQRRQARWLHN